MPGLLLYETSDPKFATTAIGALSEAGIPCYKIGEGAVELHASLGRWTDHNICIFVERQQDYSRANRILIGLGAVVSGPTRLPRPWVIALIVAALVVMALLAAQ
jgi:hypothetical protein